MMGGMREARTRVRADCELNAVVVVETLDGEVEMILPPEACIDLLLKMVGALDQLQRDETADWAARALKLLTADCPDRG
jgi:hypothetical protein